jgi:membrane protease YdiL (CAAX protease family)
MSEQITSSSQQEKFFKRLGKAFAGAFRHLYQSLYKQPWLLVLLALYLGARIGLNMAQGARFTTALMSGVMGLLFYGFGFWLIDAIYLFAKGELRDESFPETKWENRNKWAIILLLLLWILNALMIIDGFQREGTMPGTPLLGWLPGWGAYLDGLHWLGRQLHTWLPVWPAQNWFYALHNLVKWVLLPGIVLRLLGYRWKDFGISFRRWWIAAPFLVLFIAVAISNGITVKFLAFLSYTLVHPGFTEEFFNRGLLQRSLQGWVGAAGGIVLAALLFGIMHIPVYYYVYTNGNLYGTLLSAVDVAFAGVFYGYGFRRTGSVLPWVLIHALSDVVGI